jgi:hypothetical protein
LVHSDTTDPRIRGIYKDGKWVGSDWLKVDGSITDFKPGRPGYSDKLNKEIVDVDFAVLAGSRGHHGLLMMNGGTYDVRRGEWEPGKLYRKQFFNSMSSFEQSGLMVTPPGTKIPKH